jgi:hypothetical protein
MQATMHSITRHRLGTNTHVHKKAHEPQPDRSHFGAGSTPIERFEGFADKMLNFLASKRPPKTFEEVDSLLDELVRTRLNDRLTKAPVSPKPRERAAVSAVSQHANVHEGLDLNTAANASQAAEQNSRERLLMQAQPHLELHQQIDPINLLVVVHTVMSKREKEIV